MSNASPISGPGFVRVNFEGSPWRVCTNFGRASDLLARFGGWPDDVLTSKVLDELASGQAADPIPGYSVWDGIVIKPAFPFLQEDVGQAVAELFEGARETLFPVFKGCFQTGSKPDNLLLLVQTLLLSALRKKEQETGLWEQRTPQQRLGTIYAAPSHIPLPFTRVKALAAGLGRRLSFPWGGVYEEYSKLLPLMENPATTWLLSTADEDLKVIAAGFSVRSLTLLELLQSTPSAADRDTNVKLNVEAMDIEEAKRCIDELSWGMAKLASEVEGLLPEVVALQKDGVYGYLEGPGDFLEMSYGVLLGLLLRWATEEGLLRKSPRFAKYGDENWILKKSLVERLSFRKTEFAGLCVLKSADDLWERLLADLPGAS